MAAAVREPRLAPAAERVEDSLRRRAAAVEPREGSTHGLVHGELGPDHVLVDAAGRPVLIDLGCSRRQRDDRAPSWVVTCAIRRHAVDRSTCRSRESR
ncbi:phosphotransferase [Kineococcus sp. R86509]|uniref:phosphotransferase n=1 Tax=Kineococcus sp. R86509 TaxID=3093851 RepID=UPI0036D3689F